MKSKPTIGQRNLISPPPPAASKLLENRGGAGYATLPFVSGATFEDRLPSLGRRGPKRNHKRFCALCLIKIGLDSRQIARALRVRPALARLWRFQDARGIKYKLCQPCGGRPRNIPDVQRLITEEYKREAWKLKKFDEQNHWWSHPERVRFRAARQPSVLAHKNKQLGKISLMACVHCGSPIPPTKNAVMRKYCSERCDRAHYAPRARELSKAPHRKLKSRIRAMERREKLKSDLIYIIKNRLKSRIHKAFKCAGLRKNSKTAQLLGCDIPTFKAHIESQFKRGMRWSNQGRVWHIDHIFPVSKFDLSDPEQQKRAFHFSNLRPLPAFENMSKQDKIIPHQPEFPISLA